MNNEVQSLIKKAAETSESSDAMRFSQAAINAAQAATILEAKATAFELELLEAVVYRYVVATNCHTINFMIYEGSNCQVFAEMWSKDWEGQHREYVFLFKKEDRAKAVNAVEWLTTVLAARRKLNTPAAPLL